MTKRYAGVAWSGTGYEVEILDDAGRQVVEPSSWGAAEVARLIRQLGDEDFDRREAATERLSRIGEPALPLLRLAERDPDLEVRKRATRLARQIQGRLDRMAARESPHAYVIRLLFRHVGFGAIRISRTGMPSNATGR